MKSVTKMSLQQLKSASSDLSTMLHSIVPQSHSLAIYPNLMQQ